MAISYNCLKKRLIDHDVMKFVPDNEDGGKDA